MSATQTLTPEALLEAAEKLNNADLDRFVDRVLTLRARRRTRHLPEREAELLQQIAEGSPPEVWTEYNALKKKRRAETLTPEEHIRLLELYDRIEKDHARRMTYLTELAQLRGKTLREMMDELEIKSPGYE